MTLRDGDRWPTGRPSRIHVGSLAATWATLRDALTRVVDAAQRISSPAVALIATGSPASYLALSAADASSGREARPGPAMREAGRLSADALLAVLPLIALVVDAEGRVSYASPALQALLPPVRGDQPGRPASTVLYELGGAELQRCIENALPNMAFGTSALVAGPSRLCGDRRNATVSVLGVPLDKRAAGLAGTLVIVQPQPESAADSEAQADTSLLMSHELRSPLAYITASAELLCEGGLSPDEHRTLLAGIRAESSRLTNLMDTMLDMERVRSGASALALEPLELGTLAAGVVAEFRLSHPQRTFLLQEEPSLPAVLGDRARTAIVLHNLVENAVKHSVPGTPIAISINRVGGGEVTVTVGDEGDGIAPRHLGRLFQRFQQVEAVSESPIGGHGLGLYICRVLTAAQGGRIGVYTGSKQGARFWFSLQALPGENTRA